MSDQYAVTICPCDPIGGYNWYAVVTLNTRGGRGTYHARTRRGAIRKARRRIKELKAYHAHMSTPEETINV